MSSSDESEPEKEAIKGKKNIKTEIKSSSKLSGSTGNNGTSPSDGNECIKLEKKSVALLRTKS